MKRHLTEAREQWQAARLEPLKAEKALTRRSDELALGSPGQRDLVGEHQGLDARIVLVRIGVRGVRQHDTQPLAVVELVKAFRRVGIRTRELLIRSGDDW